MEGEGTRDTEQLWPLRPDPGQESNTHTAWAEAARTRATCECGKAGLLHSVEKPLQPRAPPFLSRSHGDTGITSTPSRGTWKIQGPGAARWAGGPVAGGGECQNSVVK